MYTNEALKAEVSYRRERLSRDFRRAGGKRRPLIRRLTRKS